MCWNLDANDVRAARAARKAATAILREHTENEDSLYGAELIIGELLSNAARHADGHVCLELTVVDGYAQISVHDTSPSFALDIRRPIDEFSESGRGLFIISELADRIGVTPLTGIGKCVSVRLNMPIGMPEALSPTCLRMWLRGEGSVCMRPRVARYQPEITAHAEY